MLNSKMQQLSELNGILSEMTAIGMLCLENMGFSFMKTDLIFQMGNFWIFTEIVNHKQIVPEI